MTARRDPLPGRHARTVETLLGLERWSLYRVDRAADGAFRLRFRHQQVGYRWRRVLRISEKRVTGYEPRTPWIGEPARRARARQNKAGFAKWLLWQAGMDCPVADAWLRDGDLGGVDELRCAILLAAEPARDAIPDVWTA